MKSSDLVANRLGGKVAVVTGAGSGLGRASAIRLAAEGAAVACADLDESAARRTAERIAADGGAALAVQVDVSSSASSEQMASIVVAKFGRVDVVFANAGIAGTGNAAELSEAVWDRVIAINLKGVWLTSRFLLPHMLERGSGVVINQASMGALVGIAGIFPYSAAKGGVVAMTKQMAIEFAPRGVRVNAICPGTIYTPLVEQSRAERLGTVDVEAANAAAAQRFPLRRLGEPEDVAAMAAFLASDEANWITGGIFPVDGGRSAA